MKKSLACSIGLTLSAVLGAPAICSAQTIPEGVSLSPMVGMYIFDGDYQLEDAPFGSIGIGYKFNSPNEIEFTYLVGQSENEIGLERNFDQIRLDYLNHFNEGNQLMPYVVVGLGHQRIEWWSDDQKAENSFLNAGVGLNYFFNEHLSFRADARAIRDFDYDSSNNFAVALGVRYLFGEVGSSAPAPTPTRTADADNDGVADSRDRCPGTPAGVQVDANGCELTRDADGDGVSDANDKCPDTAAGANVDASGCYIELTETKEVTMNVKFGNNSAQVDPGSYSEIGTLAEFLVQYPQTDVVIEGHSDERGEASYNQQLSQRRAQAVVDALVDRFNINRDRLRAVGYGEERPLVPNDSEENRARNRRVTAKVSAQVKTRQ